MLSKNYAQLLYNAVRETLETMAFAEVVPCSIRIGEEELNHENGLDDFVLGDQQENTAPTGNENGSDHWGTVAPAVTAPADGWGAPETDGWGTPTAETPAPADDSADDWGTPTSETQAAEWGEPGAEPMDTDGGAWGDAPVASLPDGDPWGDGAMVDGGGETAGMSIRPRDVDFDELLENQEDWIWSCMRVNSPEINTVWFVVSKELAMALAHNMYAGEDLSLDSPLIRDLVAELTNVFGGRLMLLLESLGGKFTLTVPEIGVGYPQLPDDVKLESILCRVLVDGEYPVLASLTFNKT